MEAPVSVYNSINAIINDNVTNINYISPIALPLDEYFEESMTNDQKWERIKKLFYLDHVMEVTDNGNLIGFIGIVIEDSGNYFHHNMDGNEYHASRYGGISTDTINNPLYALNDAGLNTFADIKIFEGELKYANYFNFNIKIKSSYYSPTNHVKVEVCRTDLNNKILEPFKIVYDFKENLAPKESGGRSGQSAFLNGKEGDYLAFRSTVTNDEGNYTFEQEKLIKLWEPIYFPKDPSTGESGNKPSVTVRYVPNFTSGNSKNKELYISSRDYNLLKDWSISGYNSETIIGYNNVLMSHGSPVDYFPIGYFCLEKQKANTNSQWFAIERDNGIISKMIVKLPGDDPDYTPSIFNTVSISVQVYPAQYAPKDYPYSIYMQITKNFDNPNVVVSGTFMSVTSVQDNKFSGGINFYDEVNGDYYNEIPFSVRLPINKAEISVTEIFCTKIKDGYDITKGIILFNPTLNGAPYGTQLEYENKLYILPREQN